MIFKNNPNIAVLKVYNNLTTERVLTISFEKGILAKNINKIHAQDVDLKKEIKIISETCLFMIYEKGFVHSDPHPGDIFIIPITKRDDTKDILIDLVDHGLYTNLTNEVKLG